MRKLENQREIIYETAKEILLSPDAKKFSIRMISSKCNIGMGTIYKYYGNKDDILLDIIKDFWMSYLQTIEDGSKNQSTFIEKVKYYYDNLTIFTKKFKYEILSKELSSNYKETGKSKHEDAQVYFKAHIHRDLISSYQISDCDALDLSSFIASNLIALITVRGYQVTTFTAVLTKILSNYKEKHNELL